MEVPISSLSNLASQHKQLFTKAGIIFQPDVWLTAPSDLAKKAKVPVDDVQAAIDALCVATAVLPKRFIDIREEPSFFTTGNDKLDKMLRGGIRMGALTEISGESYVRPAKRFFFLLFNPELLEKPSLLYNSR